MPPKGKRPQKNNQKKPFTKAAPKPKAVVEPEPSSSDVSEEVVAVAPEVDYDSSSDSEVIVRLLITF